MYYMPFVCVLLLAHLSNGSQVPQLTFLFLLSSEYLNLFRPSSFFKNFLTEDVKYKHYPYIIKKLVRCNNEEI